MQRGRKARPSDVLLRVPSWSLRPSLREQDRGRFQRCLHADGQNGAETLHLVVVAGGGGEVCTWWIRPGLPQGRHALDPSRRVGCSCVGPPPHLRGKELLGCWVHLRLHRGLVPASSSSWGVCGVLCQVPGKQRVRGQQGISAPSAAPVAGRGGGGAMQRRRAGSGGREEEVHCRIEDTFCSAMARRGRGEEAAGKAQSAGRGGGQDRHNTPARPASRSPPVLQHFEG
mmetsp:Transcript_25818/g.85069  ORF Transcript_25818/g.85069 Transcript_25818/m.85069 type:complete len:228 (+) Transcript_25818:320-1003(+)